MTTKLFTKPQLQEVVKGLRAAGYTVTKTSNGYEVMFDGTLIFKAMIGSRAYLVRYDPALLTEAKQ